MKIERSRDLQAQRTDREKQGNTYMVPKDVRPNQAHNGSLLFDGICFCVRENDKWQTLVDLSVTEDILKRIKQLEDA